MTDSRQFALRSSMLALAACAGVHAPASAFECSAPSWLNDGRLCLPAINVSAGSWLGQFDVLLRPVAQSNPQRFVLERADAGGNQLGTGVLNLNDGQLLIPGLQAAGGSAKAVMAMQPGSNPPSFTLASSSVVALRKLATPVIDSKSTTLVLQDVAASVDGTGKPTHLQVTFDVQRPSGKPLRLVLRNSQSGAASTTPSQYSLSDGSLLLPSLLLDGSHVRALFAPVKGSTGTWELVASQPVIAGAGNTGTGMSPQPVAPEEFFVNYADEDIARLLRNLKVAPGSQQWMPGGIRINSERILPLAKAEADHALAVGARLGKGRLFVYAASDLAEAFGNQSSDAYYSLLDNVLAWLTRHNGNAYEQAQAGGAKLPILAKALPIPDIDARLPISFTTVQRYTAEQLDPARYPLVYLDFRVDQAETALLEDYLRRGGAVLIAQPFYSLESEPWDTLAKAVAPRPVRVRDYPLTGLLDKIGMSLVSDGNPESTLIRNAAELRLQYSPTALDYLQQYRSGQLALSSIPGLAGYADNALRERVLNAAALSLFRTNPAHPAAASLFQSAQSKLVASLQAGADAEFACADPSGAPDPSGAIEDGKRLVRLSLDCEVLRARYENQGLQAGQAADPLAASFPGKMSGSARISHAKVAIDTRSDNDWISTGLYAPAGETFTVTVPKGVDIDLQIGAHIDSTGDHRSWKRPARIAQSVHLNEGENRLSSAFGGLIYASKAGTVGNFTLDIDGAGRAAYFKLGSHSEADWNAQLASATAPWAEIEGERVKLTLPIAVARSVSKPATVIQRWDAMRVEYDKLTGQDYSLPAPNNPGSRKEHYVPDLDISLGYMHSGYPIMTLTDVPPTWVALDDRPFPAGWGEWHEMGHNHQGEFDWDGLTEVTVNIHSMNIERFQRKDGKDQLDDPRFAPDDPDAHAPQGTWKKIDAYFLKSGRDFDRQGDPFLKLGMFWQLNLAYRDQNFYPKLYRAFREIGQAGYLKNEKRAQDSNGKKQQFMYAASLISGNNLLGFFEQWGMKPSAATISKINALNLPKPGFDPGKCRNGACPK
ncbi:M60 family metallopeptidase [Chitinimonas sp.]|uniref:M60 family metallopeptidase n=1 Tax=Chitinimonas sp. TaxID=1934313 RepID=UPI0035AE4D1D